MHERAGARLKQAAAAPADDDQSEQGRGASKRRRGGGVAWREAVGGGRRGRRQSGWASTGQGRGPAGRRMAREDATGGQVDWVKEKRKERIR